MTRIVSLEDIEQEIKRRQYEDPLKTVYTPHAIQLLIHASRAVLTLVIGGNRSGKTFSAVAEALYYCLGRSVYAEVPDPPVTVWYVMPSFGMFEKTIYPIFKQLVPWKEVKSFSERDHYVKFNNGSMLYFISADQRQMRIQGASVDFIVMDESPNESIYGELIARLIDRGGRMLMVLAPVDAKSFWIRDKIYVPHLADESEGTEVINMPTIDDEGNPLVPTYTREEIERMASKWTDPAERSARLYGEFIVRSGLVFKSFDRDVHFIKPFKIPDNYVRWACVDPQYHRFACLFFTADEHGNYYITDEYFSQDETLAARAERMAVIAGEVEQSIPVYVDSANPQDIAELNYHFDRIAAPLGAISLPMKKEIHKMVLRVHSYLEPDIERKFPKITNMGDMLGAPRLFVFDSIISTWRWNEQKMTVSRLIWELERLSWGQNGKPDKQSADGADACDCLIYGTAIQASGVRQPEREKWKDGLSSGDIAIWKAIERQDKRGIDYLDYLDY